MLLLALSEGGGDEPGLLRPEVISSSALVGYDLRPFDVVMLCNVDVQPDDQLAAALGSYARQGGALVFTLGDQVNPEDYTSALERVPETHPGRAGLLLQRARCHQVLGNVRQARADAALAVERGAGAEAQALLEELEAE